MLRLLGYYESDLELFKYYFLAQISLSKPLSVSDVENSNGELMERFLGLLWLLGYYGSVLELFKYYYQLATLSLSKPLSISDAESSS